MGFKLVEKEYKTDLQLILNMDLAVEAEGNIDWIDYERVEVLSFTLEDVLLGMAKSALNIPQDTEVKHQVSVTKNNIVISIAWIEEDED